MINKGVSDQGEDVWVKSFLRMYVGIMNMKEVYDRVKKGALWPVLRMYDVGKKPLSGFKNIYINSLAYVKA